MKLPASDRMRQACGLAQEDTVAEPVTYRRKVRFSDIDVQGHVFNANYMVYFDDALTDYLDALGLAYAEVAKRGHDMVMVRAECDFRSSAALAETLLTRVRTERVGNTSITFGLTVTEASEDRLVAEGREIYVILDGRTRKPVPVPDYMREAIRSHDGG